MTWLKYRLLVCLPCNINRAAPCIIRLQSSTGIRSQVLQLAAPVGCAPNLGQKKSAPARQAHPPCCAVPQQAPVSPANSVAIIEAEGLHPHSGSQHPQAPLITSLESPPGRFKPVRACAAAAQYSPCAAQLCAAAASKAPGSLGGRARACTTQHRMHISIYSGTSHAVFSVLGSSKYAVVVYCHVRMRCPGSSADEEVITAMWACLPVPLWSLHC